MDVPKDASVYVIANLDTTDSESATRGSLIHLTTDLEYAREVLRWETERAGEGDDIAMFAYSDTDIDLVIAPGVRHDPIRLTKVY